MAARGTYAHQGSLGDLADEALEESREYVRHLWSGDVAWCVERLAPTFVWIGPRRDERTFTPEEFGSYLTDFIAKRGHATVSEEAYRVVSASETDCGVAGRYLAIGQPEGDQIKAQRYRVTLVWHVASRQLQLAHVHLSAPREGDSEGEAFPVRADSETYRYMKSLAKLGNARHNVSLYDTEGTVHWVHPSQVIYLEAQRKRTIVHCMTRDIVVPAVIKDTIDMIGSKIVRVHRSYAVNRDHVVELKAGRLLLDDGTSIGVPAKRLADVRALLS